MTQFLYRRYCLLATWTTGRLILSLCALASRWFCSTFATIRQGDPIQNKVAFAYFFRVTAPAVHIGLACAREWGGDDADPNDIPNDDLFWQTGDYSLFPPWSTWAAVIQNIKAQRLEYCPDCHLAQTSLRKGAGEHVLHCDGSLKRLTIPRVWAKMLSCKLLSTTAAFVLYILWCWSRIRNSIRNHNIIQRAGDFLTRNVR